MIYLIPFKISARWKERAFNICLREKTIVIKEKTIAKKNAPCGDRRR
jgi:hypothetical protein